MRAAVLMGALALGCGGESAEPTTSATDSGTTSATDTASAPIALGKIIVKVNYKGTRVGRLGIGAFTEPEPKTKPPVAFDTSKTPSFPYPGELRGLEPGKYWVVALLDLEPFNAATVRPGDEDTYVISTPVEIKGGDEQTVEVTLAD